MSIPSKLDTSCPPLSTIKLPRILASVPPTLKHPEISTPTTLSHNASAFSAMNHVNNSYQQAMPTTETAGKSSPNKRGRKPLTTMPSAKKHYQNLKNQRAFRQRRADYVQELESKASTYERLYNELLKENKILKERLAMLERRHSTDCEGTDRCTNEQKGNKISTNKKSTSSCCNVVDTTIYTVKRIEDDQVVEDVASCDEKSTVQSTRAYVQTSYHKPDGVSYNPSTNQNLPSLTPDTLPSINFNEQPQFQQLENHTPEDFVMKEPLFCTTEEGDLCYCDPSKDSSKSDSGKIIISKEFVSQYANSIRSTHPGTTNPFNKSNEWQPKHDCCAQSLSPMSTNPSTADESTFTRNHPLDLNWILDAPREPSCTAKM
ncbi:5508_t:CDS:1 [Dentiscutata heterogama]|uniref:5508_t:CDS:1 n=1 Tax=Dentiscutata heterogama TaxID=1316150 RepID=A0ACA9MYU4_9GLOM|nr:5508_t:CDS:1 [Dentiscutata heterogama]